MKCIPREVHQERKRSRVALMRIYENCAQWKGDQGIVDRCFPLFPVPQEPGYSLHCMFKTNKIKHFSSLAHNLIV